MQGEGINLVLGKSLLFAFFNDILAGGRLPMNELYHFPFIFAGWIGLLVVLGIGFGIWALDTSFMRW